MWPNAESFTVGGPKKDRLYVMRRPDREVRFWDSDIAWVEYFGMNRDRTDRPWCEWVVAIIRFKACEQVLALSKPEWESFCELQES